LLREFDKRSGTKDGLFGTDAASSTGRACCFSKGVQPQSSSGAAVALEALMGRTKAGRPHALGEISGVAAVADFSC
jgi:hypothetical protein